MELKPESETKRVVVGAIIGAHGVRGDVRVKSFTAMPDAVFSYGPLLDAAGACLLEVKSARPAKDHFIVTPKAPRQKEEWDALKGTKLHVLRAALGDAGEDEFFIDDLVGLAVFAGGDAPVGTVKAVQNFGAGDLIEIQPEAGGKTVFVPFTHEDVPTVDVAAGRIVAASFDLWADESGSSEEDH